MNQALLCFHDCLLCKFICVLIISTCVRVTICILYVAFEHLVLYLPYYFIIQSWRLLPDAIHTATLQLWHFNFGTGVIPFNDLQWYSIWIACANNAHQGVSCALPHMQRQCSVAARCGVLFLLLLFLRAHLLGSFLIGVGVRLWRVGALVFTQWWVWIWDMFGLCVLCVLFETLQAWQTRSVRIVMERKSIFD